MSIFYDKVSALLMDDWRMNVDIPPRFPKAHHTTIIDVVSPVVTLNLFNLSHCFESRCSYNNIFTGNSASFYIKLPPIEVVLVLGNTIIVT